MKRNLYTDDELILCAYIALYGRVLLIEKKIASTFKRSETSIIMKVQNIASMLDEEGVKRSSDVSGLTGATTGQDGRRTNWDIVSELVKLSKDKHKQLCKYLISKKMLEK